MIFVTVFLVRLWNDAPELLLLLTLRKHESVLIARPLLEGSKSEPRRFAVLISIVNGMARRQVMVGIEVDDPSSCEVSPIVVPVAIEIVTQVPRNIGIRCEASYCIADEAAFVGTEGSRVNATIVHIQDQGDDDVSVASILQSTIKFLPVGNVKTAVIESGMKDILRLLGGPGS